MSINKNKDNESSERVNSIIREITTGSLGTVLKKRRNDIFDSVYIDELYLYDNKRLKLSYSVEGYYSNRDTLNRTYRAYYNDILVYNYNNKKDNVKCIKKQTSWINELYRVYNNYLEISLDQQLKYQQEQSINQKIAKVNKVFGLVDSAGYMDDKIIIDRISVRMSKAPEWSNSKDEIILNGRIRLLDGTVIYDTKKNIFHPGYWIEYVCYLVDLLELQRRQEQLLRSSQYNYEQQQKRLARQREYDDNHLPIDDFKYFKK